MGALATVPFQPCMCLQGDPEGQRWVLDAAANCTQGKWNNGVSTIIVRGDVAVDGASGNLTVLSTALVSTALPCCCLQGRQPCWMEQTTCAQRSASAADPGLHAPPHPQGTEIKVLEEGDGDYPPPGFNITADYTLWLANGTWIESTVGGEPLSIELGSGHLVSRRGEAAEAMSKQKGCSSVAPAAAAGLRPPPRHANQPGVAAHTCPHVPLPAAAPLPPDPRVGRGPAAHAGGRDRDAGGPAHLRLWRAPRRRPHCAQQHSGFPDHAAVLRRPGALSPEPWPSRAVTL